MLRYTSGEDTHHIDFVHWIDLQCIPPDRCLFDIFELYAYQRTEHYHPVFSELDTG